ncbi:MAG: D-tyrosyl-tRNA(Tyr) deacylase [Ruminococcaceae bacterium]|nr:D-tyrosyl-tRNA(Tyr) deacylase [Oscillospiraceae bacterium]
MRFVIQRVTSARVDIDGHTKASIDKGFAVLIGIGKGDDEAVADKLISKMIGLRIFEDSEGKTNLDLSQVGGKLLLISQFTLYADCKKGHRPGFTDACEPERAKELYGYIVRKCSDLVGEVGTGEFGADMKVTLTNDGPFTIILDSERL